MSIEAVAWALKTSIGKSTKKFVLVCMANYSDEHGRCWPSLPTLARNTAQDIKTVRCNVRELLEEGFLEDTGKRVGQTKSVVVYRLRLGSHTDIGAANPTENGMDIHTNFGRHEGRDPSTSHAGNGSASNDEPLPKTDAKPYQKRTSSPTKNGSEALPKLVGRTVREPSLNRQRIRQYPADAGLMEKLEQVKRVFPKRAGSQPWRRAASALRARLKAGADIQQIVDGVGRYQHWCKTTGKVGTEHVMQAATFLGPEEHYAQAWDPPLTRGEIKQQSNIDASKDWLEEQERNDAAH